VNYGGDDPNFNLEIYLQRSKKVTGSH